LTTGKCEGIKLNGEKPKQGGFTMNRKRDFVSIVPVIAIFVAAFIFTAFGFQNSSEHKVLFEKAKFMMETKGDLNAAIALFEDIIAKYPGEREYAAKSQFQIGICYEKLGRGEAVKAYELVLKNYADQPELAAEARRRMAALKMEEPKGLTVLKIPRSVEEPNYSRDGTKVVGNIWSIPGQNIGFYDYTTEKLTPITHLGPISSGEGITYWAVFSPDAKEVAYWFSPRGKQTGELRVSGLDGKTRTICRNLTGTIYPCDWLPDGSAVLAFARDADESWRLGLVPAQGGEFKELCNIGLEATSAAVSPDGRFIAYGIEVEGKGDIAIMTVEGETVGSLVSHPAEDVTPLWSPDGKYVVFKSDRHGGGAGLWGVAVKDGRAADSPFLIKVGMENTDLINWTSQGLACKTTVISRDVFVMPVDPQTGEPQGEPRMVDYTPTGDNMQPVWSPDGKYLAWLSVRDKAYIVVVPAHGGEAREYQVPFDNFWGIGKWWLMHLAWLPDSSRIGFKTMWPLPGEEEPTLICLDLDSGEWKRWHVPVSWNGAWGEDGNSYIYEERVKGDETGLVIRDLTTGKEHGIYQPPEGKKVTFRALNSSQDFKKIIFRTGGNWVTLNVETGESKVVIEGVNLRHPTWSPDGKHLLAFGLAEDGSKTRGLIIVPEAGGTPRFFSLGNSLFQRSSLYYPDWSPDGTQIAFHTQNWFTENFYLQNVIPKK
jgi:Tol biopolymer transport system component